MNNLTKYYGKNTGVENVNLSVSKGDIFGFIGPNGAGKSTTIRMLLQLTYPTSGSVELFGLPLHKERPSLRRKIGSLSSEVHYYKEMTGKQILQFTAKSHGLSLQETPVYEYAERFQFDMNKKVKSFSLGNRKKLGILQGLLHEPELLILDEPTSGLDPLMQQSFFQLLNELNHHGVTIFFSTHVLSEVEKLCNRVAFIKSGKLLETSHMTEVKGMNERVIEVTFTEPGDKRKKFGLADIDPYAAFTQGVHYITVRGRLHEALQRIVQYPITDISIHKPTLEQLFMQHYDQKESDGDSR